MSEQVYEQLRLFPGDFHVNRSPQPGSAEAIKTTVTSGRKCLELFKNSSPLGSLVRMLLGSSQWHSTRCLLTWKPAATKHRRLYFRLVPSVPRTGGTGSQYWPTPTARDYKGSNSMEHLTRPGGGKNHTGQLANAVKLWPTPTARDYKSPDLNPNSTRPSKKTELPSVVALFPTPTTGAGLCGGTGNYNQLRALEEAGQITEEERRSMAAGNGGQLNPYWVGMLMGFPPGWTELDEPGTTTLGNVECPASPPECQTGQTSSKPTETP